MGVTRRLLKMRASDWRRPARAILSPFPKDSRNIGQATPAALLPAGGARLAAAGQGIGGNLDDNQPAGPRPERRGDRHAVGQDGQLARARKTARLYSAGPRIRSSRSRANLLNHASWRRDPP